MRVIDSENRIIEDSWERFVPDQDEAAPEEGDIIVPYSYWQKNREQLLRRSGRLGVSILGDSDIAGLAADVGRLALIAIEFPEFKDGRLYSQARLLKERFGYTGELRAVGDVLRDQLFYMRRCGVDSFEVRSDRDIEDALAGLADFSVTYQSAGDGRLPLFRQR